ncbi:MAG TPA: 2-oxoacid:acceptor oxidoreductase subunit alpha [Planctomycetota bacterium]|nr:2-oxoacid:acceptor oxidoreductase subunit alpha [Planctomycetota bacterium]
MSSTLAAQPVKAVQKPAVQPIINNFSIQVATANGSGSQSSNNVLMRSIFQMGIPVSGKNLFPSNIQGLPTWFTIRASKDGYVGRKKEIDILVCMNPETAVEDVKALDPGTVCIYDAPLRLNKIRNDVQFFEVPFAKLAAGIPDTEARIRKLLANMCYVGVLAELLQIEFPEIEKAIAKQFKGKAKAVGFNVLAAKAGLDYAKEHLPKLEKFRLQRMDKTAGKIIIEGNAAAAIGSLFAGCTVVGWYPITPSSSLIESFIPLARKYRMDPATGKATFAIVQAEDELASLGIVLGAGWAGARAMTSTAGPGISLMNEFIGLAYYAEIPGVIMNVQRVGPSTGLPTRTYQGDLISCAFASHGDTKHIMLLPGSVQECYEMAVESFNLAEQFQSIVFVMLDLDLGMNNWMADPFPYPDKPITRGKVLNAEQLEQLKQAGKAFERYRDVDGDGIPYRTLPGTDHPMAAYFTRGSGHNEKAQYSEKPDDYVRNVDRLARKFETARKYVPGPVRTGDESAEVGVIAFGSTDSPMQEAIDQLSAQGVKTEYLRIRAYPFTDAIHQFIDKKKRIYVVEQNRDAQMLQLLKLDLKPELTAKLRSVLHYNGLPIDARSISDEIVKQERK